MSVKTAKPFVNSVISDAAEHDSSWVDIAQYDAFTVYLGAVKTLLPGDLTLSLRVSGSPASELNDDEAGHAIITYDKLLTAAGTDAPASSATRSADGGLTASKSPEDVIRSVSLRLQAASGDPGNFWTANVFWAARRSIDTKN